ncbi:serine/threonine-protein kinase sid1-like, partial [Gastrolobium bilobum]|uniref:serine/threonine-protein kinase sid1-like n=1 Tax=Gastrolobium bilobum TaxID=150636 RepID=UPI002AB03DBC
MVAPEKCIGNVVAVKSSMPHSIGSLMREESIIRSLIGCEELLQCHFGQFTIEKSEFIYNLVMEFAPYAGVVHCDLKPDNILLFPSSKNDAKNQLKIADFGLSKTKEEIINAEYWNFRFRGTPLYMSPESRNPPTSKEMIPTTNEMMYKLAVFEEAPKIPNGVSEDCRDFLSKRFIKNPSQRWTASKLLHHPFLFSPYDSFRVLGAMVPVSRTEGGAGTQILSAIVRKTIQSIKEIVGNHSDADIYVALKETNMDPNEATLKLLNQDPFHEVRRRRDRKKEPRNIGNKGSADPRRHYENVGQGMKSHISSERNVLRRINYSRNTFQSVGAISKTEQFSRTNVTEPSFPGMTVSRPSLNNQYNSRPHQQLARHQRVSQQNKVWKPKSSQKSNSNTPGVIGTPKKAASPPVENSIDIESNAAE